MRVAELAASRQLHTVVLKGCALERTGDGHYSLGVGGRGSGGTFSRSIFHCYHRRLVVVTIYLWRVLQGWALTKPLDKRHEIDDDTVLKQQTRQPRPHPLRITALFLLLRELCMHVHCVCPKCDASMKLRPITYRTYCSLLCRPSPDVPPPCTPTPL